MTTLQIPDRLGTLVRREARASGYHSANAFARDVLLADQKRRAGEKLAAMIQEGRDSGRVEADDAFWEGLRLEVEADIAAKARKKK